MELAQGQVKVWRRLVLQAQVLDVADHAHNFNRAGALIVVVNEQARADRVSVRPEAAGEGFAD
jgi:hypothetical protein